MATLHVEHPITDFESWAAAFARFADALWVPRTCATWADVWQMATGSIWRSMSVGPVLAWPEVG